MMARYHRHMPAPHRHPHRSILATVLLASAGLAACDRPSVSNRIDAAPGPARAATALALGDAVGDVTFRTLDGDRAQLQDFDGPVLVNFWATSCAVCLEEAPALVALRDRLAGAGFEMVSVAMPYDRPDAVLELASANGWRHPVAIDLEGEVLAAFEPVIGTPTNLLIGADGTLRARYVGRTDLAALERRVRGLLADDVPPE